MCDKSSSALKLAVVHSKVASESFHEITHVLQMTFNDPIILVPAQFRILHSFYHPSSIYTVLFLIGSIGGAVEHLSGHRGRGKITVCLMCTSVH